MTTLVITMAGHGKRVEAFNPSVPKPFLNVAGKPALFWALSSFDLKCFEKVIFITNKQVYKYRKPDSIIEEMLKERLRSETIVLESIPNGQALTLREGLLQSNVPGAFCVFNCDTLMEKVDEGWFQKVSGYDGALGVFQSTNPSLSYVRTNSDGQVEETAEKKIISNLGSSGLYWFNAKSSFLDLRIDSKHEAYIAPMYNQMIERNQRVVAVQNNYVFPIGTIPEIEAFLTSPELLKFLSDRIT